MILLDSGLSSLRQTLKFVIKLWQFGGANFGSLVSNFTGRPTNNLSLTLT